MTKLTWPGIGTFVDYHLPQDEFNFVKLDKPYKSCQQISLRPRILENLTKTMLNCGKDGKSPSTLTELQIEMLGLLSSYKNLCYSNRTYDNSELIRVVYCAHALNHILKTRSRVISHNTKLAANKTEKEEYRDQGLTRPKVLIVVPFRDAALKIVNCMISLLFGDTKDKEDKRISIMNYKRFVKEFENPDDEDSVNMRKPEDYRQTFAGNIDDSFRIGLSVTKRTLKLYSEFFSSDIIIASPLGLRMIIGAEGEEQADADFLSSIEVVILDQTEIFLMQNWDHLLHLMNNMHLQPKENHNVDYSRVKIWVLELLSKYYFQLIMFSSVSSSLINGFFNKHSTNFAGRLVVTNEIARNHAAINRVYIQCPQIFHRFSCDSFANNSNARFNFFINKILPKFQDKMMVRTMIYVPSYFDFVRLRNYFRQEDTSFVQICEYTKPGKVAKARHIFFYGGRQFLLITERFHFFNRYTIKGIRHLIFYEPPTFPHFYSELVNSMHMANQGSKLATDYSSMSVTVLFNKYDAHSLVGLVGSKTMSSLMHASTDVHMFLTENVAS